MGMTRVEMGEPGLGVHISPLLVVRAHTTGYPSENSHPWITFVIFSGAYEGQKAISTLLRTTV